MTTLRQVFATSHVDLHGDKITRGALEGIVEQMRSQYIPFGYDHDPRLPPVGRVVDAALVPLEDGEWGVEGAVQLFDDETGMQRGEAGRSIPISTYPEDHLEISYDRSHRGADDAADVQRIGEILGTVPREKVKKALEPLSILTIGGAFVLGQVCSGFLGRLGADSYGLLLNGLKRIFGRRPTGQDRLLKFEAVIGLQERQVAVELILTNPSDTELEQLPDLLAELDRTVPALLEGADDVRRMVLQYRDGRLSLSFGVRSDAVPVMWRRAGDASEE